MCRCLVSGILGFRIAPIVTLLRFDRSASAYPMLWVWVKLERRDHLASIGNRQNTSGSKKLKVVQTHFNTLENFKKPYWLDFINGTCCCCSCYYYYCYAAKKYGPRTTNNRVGTKWKIYLIRETPKRGKQILFTSGHFSIEGFILLNWTHMIFPRLLHTDKRDQFLIENKPFHFGKSSVRAHFKIFQ